MPTIHRERGYTFRFKAVDRREPPHVHVRGNGGIAKVWLTPTVRLAHARQYTAVQIEQIVRVTRRRQDEFVEAWYRFFA